MIVRVSVLVKAQIYPLAQLDIDFQEIWRNMQKVLEAFPTQNSWKKEEKVKEIIENDFSVTSTGCYSGLQQQPLT